MSKHAAISLAFAMVAGWIVAICLDSPWPLFVCIAVDCVSYVAGMHRAWESEDAI